MLFAFKNKHGQMTKSTQPTPESAEEVLPENPEIEAENNNYIKKLELQRSVLKKLINQKFNQTTTDKGVDELCPDQTES